MKTILEFWDLFCAVPDILNSLKFSENKNKDMLSKRATFFSPQLDILYHV